MSSPPLTDPDGLRGAVRDISLSNTPEPVARVSFWLAIILPFLYFPLLVGGLASRSVVFTFVVLVLLHVVTLVLGHQHRDK